MERAISGQHGRVAGYLPIGRVGHSRFNAIVHVARLAFHCYRQRDGQLAIGVQHAFLFLLLGLVVGIVFGTALIGCLVGVAAVVRVFLVPPVMLRGVNHVLHLRIRHRLAKEIARIDHRLNLVSLQDALRRRSNFHLVFRLLVLLHVEAALVYLCPIAGNSDAVVAKPRVGCQRQVSSHSAMSADGQLLGENRLVISVRYREFHSLYGGKNLLVVLLLANHGFDVNGVSGPVDGPVRIDIGQQVGRPILPEPITPRSDNRHVLPVPRQNPHVVDGLSADGIRRQRS